MSDLKGKRVLVVGLGKSGTAAVRHCTLAGALVTATDSKGETELQETILALKGLSVEYALGRNDFSGINDTDLIVVSPGVPLDLPEFNAARGKKIPIVGEMELAVKNLDRPIIAITGTNGKTTTTALVGHLLSGARISACVAGNIGTPILDVVDKARRSEFVVLEVSSFQIETTPSLKPYIAILLNVTPDHLDRHKTFESYLECKTGLMDRVPKDGYGIYNAADEAISHKVISSKCRLVPFDPTGRIISKRTMGNQAWFGDGDLNVRVNKATATSYSLGEVQLEGAHNRENMLAALLASEICGADAGDLARALKSFRGLPHRVELVGEHRGVRYYDDSKGTNIGATIKALQGFAEPVVLIAGGLSKGVDFSPLSETVARHVKKLVLIGEAAEEMDRVLGGRVDTVRAKSMSEAVMRAKEAAEPGDVVLLSPACASFDMFRDYADRGNQFAEAVKLYADRSSDKRQETSD